MAKYITHLDTTGFAPPLERWCAYEDSYDGPGCPLGRGATEDAAIADLEQQLDDADEAAEAAGIAACEQCNGTGWYVARTTFPHSYVAPGEAPEYAANVTTLRCTQCRR